MNVRQLTVMLLHFSVFNIMSCGSYEENFIRPSYCLGSVSDVSYRTVTLRSVLKCSALCAEDCRCLSVSYFPANRTCKLSHDIIAPDCMNTRVVPGSLYYQKKGSDQVCQNGGVMSGDHCNCIGGHIGRCCERIMRDCSDGFRNGYEGKPRGLYKVFPPGAPLPFTVHCRMEWGGRTYVLQHYNPHIYFNLTWSDYVEGFDFEFDYNDWIGLKKLNWLTNARYLKLYIELMEDHNDYQMLVYDDFHVGDASTEFRLLSAGLNPDHSLNLTDCLGLLVGSAFSTKDRDNDGNDERNCSQDYRSGWWFNSQCSQCNPMGDIQYSLGGPRTWVNHEVYWNDLSWSPEAISMWLK